jgi:hypothetical protein
VNRTRRKGRAVASPARIATESQRTALVVEPDRDRRGRIRRALERRGYQVMNAGTQASAFEILDGAPADVLVSPEPGASTYRVVWLSSERSTDIIIAATPEGWKLFDEAVPGRA